MLSRNFSTREFSCSCNYEQCVNQKIAIELVNRLEELRAEIKLPIIITSAYRCTDYQRKLSKDGLQTAKKLSQHTLGNAVDILTTTKFSDLKRLSKKYFKAVGLAETFIHVDLRSDKKRLWYYS